MKSHIFAANWKMNMGLKQVNEWCADFLPAWTTAQAGSETNDLCIIAPTYTHIPMVAVAILNTQAKNVALAAQNMAADETGAFTGEVSAQQLKELGVTHVIIGHSERRYIYGETDEQINKKLILAEKHQIIPILCVGETLQQRATGQAEDIVKQQVSAAIQGLTPETVEKMIIAYEPVWAVGSGNPATPEDAIAMFAVIRQVLPNHSKILYGGSVNAGNAPEFLTREEINGLLVGGDSTRSDDWKTICHI